MNILLQLPEEEFKNLFMETIKKLSDEDIECNKREYIMYVNHLIKDKLIFKAHNDYDFWIQYNTLYNDYSYTNIMCITHDMIKEYEEDNNTSEKYCMTYVIKDFIRNFGNKHLICS